MQSRRLLLIALFGSISMLPFIASAQDRPRRGEDPGQRSEERLSSLIERLKLSSQQEAEVRAIFSGARTEGRRKKNRQQIRERLERVLTPEQLKTYDEWSARDSRRERGSK